MARPIFVCSTNTHSLRDTLSWQGGVRVSLVMSLLLGSTAEWQFARPPLQQLRYMGQAGREKQRFSFGPWVGRCSLGVPSQTSEGMLDPVSGLSQHGGPASQQASSLRSLPFFQVSLRTDSASGLVWGSGGPRRRKAGSNLFGRPACGCPNRCCGHVLFLRSAGVFLGRFVCGARHVVLTIRPAVLNNTSLHFDVARCGVGEANRLTSNFVSQLFVSPRADVQRALAAVARGAPRGPAPISCQGGRERGEEGTQVRGLCLRAGHVGDAVASVSLLVFVTPESLPAVAESRRDLALGFRFSVADWLEASRSVGRSACSEHRVQHHGTALAQVPCPKSS